MAAPPSAVYAEVADFRRWRGWSPWEDADPALERNYDGADSGVGATYAWSGNRKAGAGTMEVTAADEPSSLDVELKFLKPFKATNSVRFAFTAIDGGTEVVWTMSGATNFMTKVMGVFFPMDKVVGGDFEKGLAALAAVVEGDGSSGAASR